MSEAKFDVASLSEKELRAFRMRAPSGAPDACWPWSGHRNDRGYGMLRVKRAGRWVDVRASRIAWFVDAGAAPGPLFVLHRCDNPPCVNPAHLFLGTVQDNTADMMQKGRHRPNGLRGEDAPGARLTEQQAAEIRRRAIAGEDPAKLAGEHGVSVGHVKNLARGGVWQHVDGPPYQRKRRAVTPEIAEQIGRLVADGTSFAEASRQVGVSERSVSRVARRAEDRR